MFKRLYVQYQPVGPSHAVIADLINVAYRKDDGARPVPNDQIHLTVIHFGLLDTVYSDILSVNPTLARATFDTAAEQFAEICVQSCPTTITLKATEFSRFGKNKQTLVVVCEETEALQAAHNASLQALKEMFVSCGVPEPTVFMMEHHNFKHALTISPHITLIKNAHKTQDLQLPEDMLELQLMKVRYDAYTGVK